MARISAEVRQMVFERARNCCEYCRMAQGDRLIPFEVDHVIAVKHGGDNSLENLCLACYKCNSFKGSNIASIDPQSGKPAVVFNPRRQQWSDHFRLDGAVITPLSPEGRITTFLLRLNAPERIKQRLTLIQAGRYPCP